MRFRTDGPSGQKGEMGGVLFDPIAYYSPETLLFPGLARRFADTGRLEPAALYLILDWKASRARTRHRSRLARIAGSFKPSFPLDFTLKL